MRKLSLFLLLGLAGCQGVVGPLEPRYERADDPFLTANEQKRKARYLTAYPDQELGPRSGVWERDLIGPHGQ